MSGSSNDSKRTDEVKERLVNLWDEIQSPSFLYSARQSYIISNFGGDIPSFQKVQSFLNQTGAYDWAKKKWTRLDGRGTNLNVEMQCILTKLVRRLGSRGMRVFSLLPRFHDVVLETRLDFEENWAVRTTPDLVVIGKGKNFKDAVPGHKIDAFLWSSHIERTSGVVMVRTDVDFDNAHDKILLEATYYASECFYEQGNRIFFHVVVVTNSRVQLLRFDRSGCLASPATNIHECPGYFMQCLLLLSTMKDTVLGFDKMITWKGYSRFIETENLEKKDVKYRLLNPILYFDHSACKAVTQRAGELWVNTMLLAVHGVEGVGQVLGYEEDISLYNRRGHSCIDENFEDRPASSSSSPSVMQLRLIGTSGTVEFYTEMFP
ncbi:hypothetical protein NLJ89_g7947 [Agrocybe chaxingu]|uniref:Fungal-type protein kinase domain-containing protein n=1 Tax=Agrocybe chaxingu TaxID=84603 RepID=A0A9W8JVP0_9AGAR|nr:hypothetical protein NLJ89_g7947 [Agrocybe chaxingu]